MSAWWRAASLPPRAMSVIMSVAARGSDVRQRAPPASARAPASTFTTCNMTHANACLFQRLRTRLDAAGLPSQWLDGRPQGSDAEAPVSAANGRTKPPPQPPPPLVLSRLAASPPPPPPSNEPATDDSRLEPCVPPSGRLQLALEQEAASSREVLARLGAHACDGVGDECRQLGDATPASPAVCPLSGACRPSAAGVAASAPRIFAYDCMDGVHAQLLSQPHVTEFFDANLPRNQFVSEVALHRSLLVRRAAHRALAATACRVPRRRRHAAADSPPKRATAALRHTAASTAIPPHRHTATSPHCNRAAPPPRHPPRTPAAAPLLLRRLTPPTSPTPPPTPTTPLSTSSHPLAPPAAGVTLPHAAAGACRLLLHPLLLPPRVRRPQGHPRTARTGAQRDGDPRGVPPRLSLVAARQRQGGPCTDPTDPTDPTDHAFSCAPNCEARLSLFYPYSTLTLCSLYTHSTLTLRSLYTHS